MLLWVLRCRDMAPEFNFVRTIQRNVRLLEAQFYPAPKFARHLILAVENRPDLKSDDRAVQSERFYAEDSRSVHQGRGPCGVGAKIPGDLIKGGEGAAHQLVGWHADIHERL